MGRNTYHVDEDLSREFDIHAVKRLLSYVGAQKKPMFGAAALMIIASLASLVPPYLLKTAIDDMIPRSDVNGLLLLGLITLIAQAIVSLFLHLRIRIMTDMGQSIIHKLRSDIFEHLQKLGFTYFDSRPHGKILIRVVNYVNSLSDLLSNGIINLISDLFSLVFIIGFMLFIDVRLTMVCLTGLPLMAIVVLSLKRKQRITWQEHSRKQSNLNAYLHESLSGVRITQSFARERKTDGIFTGLGRDVYGSWMAAVKAFFLVWPGIELISVIGVAAVYISGVSRLNEGMQVGVLVAFIGYVWRFWAPMVTIGNFYSNLVQSAAYLERIFETIDEPIDDPLDASWPSLPPIDGKVTFSHVDFSYDAGHPILHDVDFQVEPGTSVAIVGPTGAGKTTIVSLLSRFYRPTSGSVWIDGIDIAKVNHRSIRTQVGVMLQDSFLFSGTIADNIRYGKLDATDEEVEAASKAVMAHEFIMGLPEGYKTVVNERGSRLSMGQRQLISFARALLADPAILILDEATSSVDTETERAIQKGMRTLLAGRTSFVIAHRLSTIKHVDTIMFVDGGRIVEQGSHDQLCAVKGAYWKLYASAQQE